MTAFTVFVPPHAQADSTRIIWNVNGNVNGNGNDHYYQRFDRLETRGDASQHCESLGAHLATITSGDEQNFIQGNILAGINANQSYFIGGDGADSSGGAGSDTGWKWITGEPWNYTNWAVNGSERQPNNRTVNNTNEDYLIIFAAANADQGLRYKWFDVFVNDAYQGHICEWSFDRFIGTTSVPDLNGNGVDEIAALFVDHRNGEHTVRIKDPASKALLSILTFQTSFNPPQGVVALADLDLDQNDTPEIGVLFSENGPVVQIKDAQNNNTLLNTIRFLNSAFTPVSVTAIADTNGNGSSEILVLGNNSNRLGKAKSQIRDSRTTDVLNKVGF
ncbi:MAG: C-type lectin domain-containing protein [Methylococcales bacterium]